MPSPIEIFLDPISLIALGAFCTLLVAEAVAPGRKLPKMKGWHVRASVSFGAYFMLSSYLPLAWDRFIAPHQLMDLNALGLWAGLIAVVTYEGAVYFWHRAMHRSKVLWRGVHQMHHSAERVDALGAFYFSPLDMVGWTLLGSLSTVWLMGMSPSAATLFLLVTFFLGVFQHTNVRTPRWLGYIVQRPESHTVHHARGIHDRNFSDLPVFDIIFGTFENPTSFRSETGFYPGASERVAEMLCFEDVSEPRAIDVDGTTVGV